jgi:hypothetical protein
MPEREHPAVDQGRHWFPVPTVSSAARRWPSGAWIARVRTEAEIENRYREWVRKQKENAELRKKLIL